MSLGIYLGVLVVCGNERPLDQQTEMLSFACENFACENRSGNTSVISCRVQQRLQDIIKSRQQLT